MKLNEFIAEATFPERPIVELNYDEIDFDEWDTLPAVIVLRAPTGEACIISPYIIPGSMTLDVALFDCVGDLVRRDLIARELTP